jgi:hypothetical protein
MRTAIIVTGHMRTWRKCWPNLQEHVFDKFGAAWFVSTIRDHDWLEFKDSHHARRANLCGSEALNSQPDCIADLVGKGAKLPAQWTPGKPYMAERYAISVCPQAVAAQLWQLERGWRLLEQYEQDNPYLGRFDCVIRCRPDIFFRAGVVPTLNAIDPLTALLPWWGRFDGTNDRFAILGRKAAEAYFTTYSQIPEIINAGGNLHPETLVLSALKRGGAKVSFNLGLMFTTERKDGTSRLPEITQDDWQALAAVDPATV